ncbi:NACHT domain-containing protein [Nodosilinea sp. P-1105]|uniref:NACHT domain-containing protein n=1 Tax=Nodosilinea sp. P-1105 TaxID=2546229 RepID=UPI00146DC370|nr:NACHT domain-containing protein [Nodosilinea sp. P-1105]NMF85313.1 NACHT domain-containing protein [Nodosilinea sp. P-1105]
MTGFLESFLLATAGSLASVAIDSAKETGGGFLNRVGKRISDDLKQRYFEASKRYIESYTDRHCKIKVLGMREPVNLDSIYTAVKFLSFTEIIRFSSVESLEREYRSDRLGGFSPKANKKNQKSGIDVANREQFLMVLGGPGVGKSTFLRKVALEAIKAERGKYSHRKIPVLIELKRLESKDIDIIKIIANEFDICGFPSAQTFTKNALDKGNLLVIFDGIDEVPAGNLNLVLTKIQDFVDRYKKNRYISSCRTAAYRSYLRGFSDVEMANFDEEQIYSFIKNWFKSAVDIELSTAENCWNALLQPENSSAKELAHTPLLLTFLCLIFDRSQAFPDNRSSLYKKALRILLEEWAAEKRIMREAIYEGLSVELEEILLSEIAFEGFVSDRLFFIRKEISSQIKQFLESNLNAPKYLDGESVLKAIEVQQGILVERAEDVYSFSHLTLQEYLTAQYIIENQLISSLVQEELFNKRWKEVLILVSGLIHGRSGSDDLLLMIEKKMAAILIHNPLIMIFDLVDNFVKAVQHYPEIQENVYQKNSSLKNRLHATYLIFSVLHDLNISQAGFYGKIPGQQGINLSNDFMEVRKHLFDIANKMSIDFGWDQSYISVRGLNGVITLYESRVASLYKAFLISDEVNQRVLYLIKSLRDRVPKNEDSSEIRLGFLGNMIDGFSNALGLDLSSIRIESQDLADIKNYLYACNLSIDCKRAAIRVSPITWKAIEDRMLTSAS